MIRPIVYRRRLGFTLIELLVVLVIIGILMALLVPAIGAAMRKARGAAVQAEINQFAQAIADFKNKFGDYPPSRIAIREDGGYFPADTTAVSTSNGSTGDVLLGTLYLRGATAIRKFWPRVTLTSGTSFFPAKSTLWYDYNGDGTLGFQGTSTVFVLQGHECLVFFLGGIAQPDSTGTSFQGMSGFGKNPTNPFSNNTPGNTMYNQNRNTPLLDFDAGRLRMSGSGSGMAAYVDSLNPTNAQASAFYAYFSTNNGSGYDPNDVNAAESDNNATSPITLNFQASQGLTKSPSPNPYTSSPPAGVSSVSYINAQSFQIISSGVDGVFGLGGSYNSSSATGALPSESGISNSTDPLVRVFEKDNLTNFHNGTLD